jgi:dynein light chain Tctex-type 1
MADQEIDEDDNAFPSEDIDRCGNEVAEEVLKEAMWDETLIPQWINLICEKLMKQLIGLNKPYKFMVTCIMQQKIGAPIHSSLACHWENTTDGVTNILYPPPQRAKDAQKMSFQALITIFATRF